MRVLLLVVALLAPAPPSAPPSGPRPRAPAPAEPPRAFLLEVARRLSHLESRDQGQARVGPALIEVRRSLEDAELALAQTDALRFERIRAEIAAQLDYIDALRARTGEEEALNQAAARLEQTNQLLSEAEKRALDAERRLAAP